MSTMGIGNTMAPPKAATLIAIAVVVAAACSAIHHSLRLFDQHEARNISFSQKERALMKMPLPFFGSRNNDATNYDFAIIIVSYHKTGHDLQEDLVDYITKEFPGMGPKLTEYGKKSPLRRRRHPPITPCARIHLQTGTISVQHAPDLFCHPGNLAKMLLEGGTGHAEFERGVKIVHLVRDPFSLAVSNYHYHARIPTPEPWVHTQNPCDIEYHTDRIEQTYPEMVIPALSNMKYEAMNLNFRENNLVSREEFDSIHNDCLSLYQTKDGLKKASYLDHLMNYDPPEGLRLATAQMTIQGHDNGGDIFRMANNIVKFKQTHIAVKKAMEYPHKRKKELHVYTMSLDDFNAKPGLAALKFFDFVLDCTDVSQQHKEAVAQKYEQFYYEKRIHDTHITHGKSNDVDQLKQYLRNDPIFGPPLSKIERIVEKTLEDSFNGQK